MPDHLLLPDPRPVGSRRAGGGGGATPQRQRGQHGRHLAAELDQVIAAPRRIATGVDPDLVFKIRAVSRPAEGSLEGRHLEMLGESQDFTYFVLSDDGGTSFSQAIQEYRATGAMRSLIDLIEDIEPYGPEDRRGPGLDGELPLFPLLVDVYVWAASGYAEAERRAGIIDTVVERSGGQVQLRSVSARRTVMRVQVSADGLEDLLATSVVEKVRTPPVPFLDYRDWWQRTADELARTDESSAVVGVLDDAPATQHPLLAGLILSVDELAPPRYPWQQPGNHGTEVVGRVLLPRLHEQLRDGDSITARGTVRVARILEPDPSGSGTPRFATYRLPHDLIAEAITHLHQQHGVKVFNLSIGYAQPYSDLHLEPLTERIDELVRELGVVVVVPTGNVSLNGLTAQTPSGHHVADDYPTYLASPEHRLAEPGPAALAVTVSSIALSGAVAELPNRHTWRAVADTDQVSPFSRTGPGTGANRRRRNKPDVTHYGGNVAMNDLGLVVPNEPGSSIVSTALDAGSGRLFAACNGTSYAAPAVARVAADIVHAYPDASANLVRALLAAGTRLPHAANGTRDDEQRARLYGLGLPDSDRAVSSGAQRATMTYDGAMPIDDVHIHPVPVPEIFRRGHGGRRTISLALAFDPPVRRQRREYLAASMQVDLYRNMSLEALQELLRRQDPDNRQDMIKDAKRRPKLEPGSDALISSTLQFRTWSPMRSFANDDETFYAVVTHRAATWARNDDAYRQQSYALAVTLEDRQVVQADLRQLLLQQVRMPARVRVRA